MPTSKPLIGLLILDPGIRSGLGWGTFKLEGDSFYDMFREGLQGSFDYNFGNSLDNAELAASQWEECQDHWLKAGVKPKDRYFVIEQWIPNIRKFSMDKTFASAIVVYSHVQAFLYHHEPQYMMIQPSETHAVTNKQLRDHGLWIPGKDRNGEHQLDIRKQGIQALRKLHKKYSS